ncbi:spire -like protein [Brachionus plicatilis]|uniref:Spire-like protein n=1 Tax=Brachionus plicatilis TaxID=10195 RepID=A0A3M7T7A2_BRAPC|nr:spire -like protein [Brachionus plicatilis]
MNGMEEHVPLELVDNATEDDEEEDECATQVAKVGGAAASANNSCDQLLNFHEILHLFNTAISEEQAWAVLYQVLVEFERALASHLQLVWHNLDKIDIYLLNFAKDGSISFDFGAQSDASAQTSEPSLHSSLSNLLIFISGHCKEFSEDADDEGYDQDQDDEESAPTVAKAIQICQHNVNEPDYHYKAVCRGLYAQAYELKAFLAKIEDSKKCIRDAGKDPTKYCFEILDKTDWAKIWMQVITELRHGVKLRKVVELPQTRRHIEYELTPFEILLDQIRAKQYHLKKVSLDSSLAPEIKKSARDIILEFIRSRPPLRKSSLRKLNTSRSFCAKAQPSLHEQLMNSIRNYSTPLRKIKPQETKATREDDQTSNDAQNESKRRVVKADKKLLNNLNSSDTDVSDIDDDELRDLPVLPEEQDALDIDLMKSLLESVQTKSKKRIKAPDSLRSPLAPWRNTEDEWKNVLCEEMKPEPKVNRRHTMSLADLNRLTSSISAFNIFARADKSNTDSLHDQENYSYSFKHSKVSDNCQSDKKKSTNPVYCKSGPGYSDFGYVTSHHLIKKLTSNKQKECVRLTFEELCHIRKVLTKADLDYLLFDNKIYYDVSRGRVCFSCRKTRFHLFNWGTKCRICQQKICKKCLQNAQIRNGFLVKVPLSKLITKSQSKNDSASSSSDNEDYEIISTNNDDSIEYNQDNFGDSTSLYQANQTVDICTDCYQLMDGFIVSVNENDLVETKNSPVFARKKANQMDLLKTVHLANRKNFNSDLSPAVSSSSSIGMDNIAEMNVVISTTESSPMPCKHMMSHHSSTPTNTNKSAIYDSSLNEKNTELSTIIVQSTSTNDNFADLDSFQHNNSGSMEHGMKNLRKSLTLDLQPVGQR